MFRLMELNLPETYRHGERPVRPITSSNYRDVGPLKTAADYGERRQLLMDLRKLIAALEREVHGGRS
jgi:hypothetical protein